MFNQWLFVSARVLPLPGVLHGALADQHHDQPRHPVRVWRGAVPAGPQYRGARGLWGGRRSVNTLDFFFRKKHVFHTTQIICITLQICVSITFFFVFVFPTEIWAGGLWGGRRYVVNLGKIKLFFFQLNIKNFYRLALVTTMSLES